MLLPYMTEGVTEAGCDEAGRGCLCGPVACAAVILPPDFINEDINDSKKLTAHRREYLAELIKEQAVAWAVEMVGPEEIDEINILNASITGMHRAVARLGMRPDHLIIDGNRFKEYVDEDFRPIPHHTVVKGDGKYMSIAAASILAKTARDSYMRRIAAEYPGYGWERNMGYPTKDHLAALERLGLTIHHRRSYAPVKRILAKQKHIKAGGINKEAKEE